MSDKPEVLHLLGNRRDLDTYPSAYNAMHLLARAGFLNVAALGSTDPTFEHLLARRYAFGGSVADRCRALSRIGGSFDVIISYEPDDLIAYGLARRRPAGRLLAHHSLEIPDPRPESGIVQNLLARLWSAGGVGREAFQRLLSVGRLGAATRDVARVIAYSGTLAEVSDLIVQDSLRLSLVNEFKAAASFRRIGLVPNCYIPELEAEGKAPPWLASVRGGLGHLVTYIGGIEDWALDEKLLIACAKCPDTMFLFSGWSRDGYAATLASRAAREGWKNIRIDIAKKSDAEVNAIVDASDAGLVYYASQSANVLSTGLSSGKMHKFLGRGTPVLALDLPLMGRFIEENGFGATFSSPGSDFAAALERLLGRKAAMRASIAEHYGEQCSFEASYGQMIKAWLS